MRVKIIVTDPITGIETVENVCWTDEVAEAEGMDDAEADAMEAQLRKVGRFYLSAERLLMVA